MEELSGSAIRVADPMARAVTARQPGAEWQAAVSAHIGRLADYFCPGA